MKPNFGKQGQIYLIHQGDVTAIIVFSEKGPLAAIPALGDVMG
jgi:hypothetical protein